MGEYPDEFDKLHKALVADASKHTDYAERPSVALLGYSEGAEHALDSIRSKGYVLPEQARKANLIAAADHMSRHVPDDYAPQAAIGYIRALTDLLKLATADKPTDPDD